MILKEAKEEGVLSKLENGILLNTIKANTLTIEKIMVPLSKATLVNIDGNINKMLDTIMKNRYTRIPVFKRIKTNIIGILYVKEMAIKYAQEKIESKEQIENLLREPQRINKDEKIFKVLKKLQKSNQMMGIVYNEKNIPIGLVSVEDILEELVGEIYDEDDKI